MRRGRPTMGTRVAKGWEINGRVYERVGELGSGAAIGDHSPIVFRDGRNKRQPLACFDHQIYYVKDEPIASGWWQFYGDQRLRRAIPAPSAPMSDLDGDWTEITPTFYGFSLLSDEGRLWHIDDLDDLARIVSRGKNGEDAAHIAGSSRRFAFTEDRMYLWTINGWNYVGNPAIFEDGELAWTADVSNLWDQVYERGARLWLAQQPYLDGGDPSAVRLNPIDGTVEATIALVKGPVNAAYPTDHGEKKDIIRDELLLAVESERPWGHDYDPDEPYYSDPERAFNIFQRGLIFTTDLIVPWTIQHDSVRAHNYAGELVWQHDGTRNFESVPAISGSVTTFEILSVVQVHEASNSVLVFVAEQTYEGFLDCENPPSITPIPEMVSQHHLSIADYNAYSDSLPAASNWYEQRFRATSTNPANWGDGKGTWGTLTITPPVGQMFDEHRSITDASYEAAEIATYETSLKWAWRGVRYFFRVLALDTGEIVKEYDYLDDLMIDGAGLMPATQEFGFVGEPPYSFASGTLEFAGSGGDPKSEGYGFTRPLVSEELGLTDDQVAVASIHTCPYGEGYLEYANLATLFNFNPIDPSHDIYPYWYDPPAVPMLRYYTPFAMPTAPHNPKMLTGWQDMPSGPSVIAQADYERWGNDSFVGMSITGNPVINRSGESLGGNTANNIQANFQGGTFDLLVWESITMHYWAIIPVPHRINYQVQPVPRFDPLRCTIFADGTVFFPPARRFGNEPTDWPWRRLVVDKAGYEVASPTGYPAVAALLNVASRDDLKEIDLGAVIPPFVEAEPGGYGGPSVEADTNATTAIPQMAGHDGVAGGGTVFLALQCLILDPDTVSASRRTNVIRIDIDGAGQPVIAADFERVANDDQAPSYLMVWDGEPILTYGEKIVAVRK